MGRKSTSSLAARRPIRPEMLIITRRQGERIMIGDDVVITVLEVSGSSVRIGIEAPRSTPVYREELLEARREHSDPAPAPRS
jgi:carbon storage regulator